MWGQQPDLARCWKCLWRYQWVPLHSLSVHAQECCQDLELCVHWSCWGISSRCSGTASSPGRREEVESSVQWCCFVPQSEQRRHSAHSAGGWCCHRLWWGLVVRNGLNPLPQAPSVPAVAETMGYPPGVLSLGLCDVVWGSEVGEGEDLVSSSLGGVNKVQGIFSPCRKVYVLVNFWKHTP